MPPSPMRRAEVRRMLVNMVAPNLQALLARARDVYGAASSSSEHDGFARHMATAVAMIEAYVRTDVLGVLRAQTVRELDAMVVACGVIETVRELRFPRADVFDVLSGSYRAVAELVEKTPEYQISLYNETPRIEAVMREVRESFAADEPGAWLRECAAPETDPRLSAGAAILLVASLVHTPPSHDDDGDVRRRAAVCACVSSKLLEAAPEQDARVRARVMERAVGLYDKSEILSMAPNVLDAARRLTVVAPKFLLRALDSEYKDLLAVLVNRASATAPLEKRPW